MKNNINDRKYAVYMYTNKVNGKKYIGQTCHSLSVRAGKNGIRYSSCTYFYNAIQKYGFDCFKSEILADNLTLQEANKFEKLMIKTFGSNIRKNGYNISSGGDGTSGVRHYFDYKGMKIGELTVLKCIDDSNPKSIKWLCKCNCGNLCERTSSCLSNNNNSNCGCIPPATFDHGLSKTRLYQTWHFMKQRCYNPEYDTYKFFGGNGIKVCNEWLDFVVFKEWADRSGYEDNLFLCRQNKNDNFSPTNCYWDKKFQVSANTGWMIVNLTNSELFINSKSASKYYGLKSSSTINNACKHNKIRKGCKWQYYDDYLKENNITDEEARESLFFIDENYKEVV